MKYVPSSTALLKTRFDIYTIKGEFLYSTFDKFIAASEFEMDRQVKTKQVQK